MPHVLYNHMTHSWDRPDPDDGCCQTADRGEEAPHLEPGARRALSRLALAAATFIAGFILCGIIAGLLFGLS